MRLAFLPLILLAALTPVAHAGILWTLDGKVYEGEVSPSPPSSLAIITTASTTPVTVALDNLLLATLNPPHITPSTFGHVIKSYPANTEPRGIVFKNGSFLAGAEVRSADTKSIASFHMYARTDISTAQVARINVHPLAPSLLARIGDRPGILTLSGDFSEGEFSSISEKQAKISSVVFGIAPFNFGPTPDCVATINLRKVEPENARFHVSLTTGSLFLADAVSAVARDSLQIEDRNLGRMKFFAPHVFAITTSSTAATPLTSLKPRDAANLKDYSASTLTSAFDLANGSCVPADSSAALLLPASAALTYDLAGKYAFFDCRIAVPSKVAVKSSVRFDFIVDGKPALPPRFLTSKDAPVTINFRLLAAKSLTIKIESTDASALGALGDPFLIPTPAKK